MTTISYHTEDQIDSEQLEPPYLQKDSEQMKKLTALWMAFTSGNNTISVVGNFYKLIFPHTYYI